MLPRGNINLDNTPRFTYDNAKSKRLLVLKYTGIKEILRDTFGDFQSRGFLVKDLQYEKVFIMA